VSLNIAAALAHIRSCEEETITSPSRSIVVEARRVNQDWISGVC